MRRLLRLVPLILLAAGLQAADKWRYTKEEFEGENPEVFVVIADEEFNEIMERVKRGDLPRIQFDLNSAEIRLNSYATLDVMAEFILRNPTLKLMVMAHTCNLGSKKYNLRLSRLRAKSVKRYLVIKGVSPPSIRFRGMGYSQPIADNDTDEGRRKNRRVEFRITRRGWESVY